MFDAYETVLAVYEDTPSNQQKDFFVNNAQNKISRKLKIQLKLFFFSIYKNSIFHLCPNVARFLKKGFILED